MPFIRTLILGYCIYVCNEASKTKILPVEMAQSFIFSTDGIYASCDLQLSENYKLYSALKVYKVVTSNNLKQSNKIRKMTAWIPPIPNPNLANFYAFNFKII